MKHGVQCHTTIKNLHQKQSRVRKPRNNTDTEVQLRLSNLHSQFKGIRSVKLLVFLDGTKQTSTITSQCRYDQKD